MPVDGDLIVVEDEDRQVRPFRPQNLLFFPNGGSVILPPNEMMAIKLPFRVDA